MSDHSISEEIFQSVVKLFVTHCGPWYYQPWEMECSSKSTSSGFISSTISREIICNAHGVLNSTSIQVRKHGESKKYNATIKYVGHEWDLAVLQVDDNKFWRNNKINDNNDADANDDNKSSNTNNLVKAIEFCNITPSLQDTIFVLGYPTGGDDLSVTKGVVSRVGFTKYAHSLEYLLTIQIDAAINGGNSGGPALNSSGKVIGVAFQGLTDADNIGYCIPIRVVNHFIKSKLENINYSIPSLSLLYSTVENYSLKKHLGMIKYNDDKKEEEEMQGIMILKVFPFTDSFEKLQTRDVILEIDGICIGDDGTIKYGKHSRISLNYIITNKIEGESVNLRILRDFSIINVSFVVRRRNRLCLTNLYDISVSYFIFGGLVFLPLTKPYLQHKYGRKETWKKYCPSRLSNVYFNKEKEFIDQEIVLLSQVLASNITVGYHKCSNLILKSINNKHIVKNLKHCVNIIDNLVNNSNDNEFISFEFESSQIIVLSINKCVNAMDDILKRHKIPSDRSDNLINDINDINDNDIDDDIKQDKNDNKSIVNQKDKDNDKKLDNISSQSSDNNIDADQTKQVDLDKQ